jgi:hypothetical protein
MQLRELIQLVDLHAQDSVAKHVIHLQQYHCNRNKTFHRRARLHNALSLCGLSLLNLVGAPLYFLDLTYIQ